MRLQVGFLRLNGYGNPVDGCLDIAGLDALGLELQSDGVLDVTLHADVLEKTEGLVQELQRVGAVTRGVAGQEHARVLELGASQVGAGARAAVHLNRFLEQLLGVFPVFHGGREHAQGPGGGAVANHGVGYDDVAVAVREEHPVDESGAWFVVEVRGQRSQPLHRGEPAGVHGYAFEVLRRKALKYLAGLFFLAREHECEGQRREPSHKGRVLLNEAPKQGLHLPRPALLQTYVKDLDAVPILDDGVLKAPTERESLLTFLLAIRQVALHNRAHGVPEGADTQEPRLAGLVGQRVNHPEFRIDGLNVTELERVDHVADVGLENESPVTGGLRKPNGVRGHGHTL